MEREDEEMQQSRFPLEHNIQTRLLVDKGILTTSPYQNIGLLRIHSQGGEGQQVRLSFGTAWQISTSLLLTSAHNVTNQKTQQRYELFYYPCPDGLLERYIPIDNYCFSEEYYNQSKHIHRLHDIALLHLSRPLERSTFPSILTFGAGMQLQSIYCSGYPGDKMSKTTLGKFFTGQYVSKGKVSDFNSMELEHLLETCKGSSGSPLFTDFANEQYIVAMHCWKKRGIMLNQKHQYSIIKWAHKMTDLSRQEGFYFSSFHFDKIEACQKGAILFKGKDYKVINQKWDDSEALPNYQLFSFNEEKTQAIYKQSDSLRQVVSMRPIPRQKSQRYCYTLKFKIQQSTIFGFIQQNKRRNRVSGRFGVSGSIGYCNYSAKSQAEGATLIINGSQNDPPVKSKVPDLGKDFIIRYFCDMKQGIIHVVRVKNDEKISNEIKEETPKDIYQEDQSYFYEYLTEIVLPKIYLQNNVYLFGACRYRDDLIAFL